MGGGAGNSVFLMGYGYTSSGDGDRSTGSRDNEYGNLYMLYCKT